MLPILHKMLPVDEHVPIALGLLGKAAGTGGQVVPVLHTAHFHCIKIDDIDVREGAGDQRATATQIVQGGRFAGELVDRRLDTEMAAFAHPVSEKVRW